MIQFNKKLRSIQRTFVVSIIALVSFSVISLGVVLYTTNAIELRHNVSSDQLTSLTNDYPDVHAYIQSHKSAEPHFITIANLVKADQQNLIANALFLTGIPVFIISAVLAYGLARRLVRPVEETFAAQERFLQDASHEMRNPLAAISAVIQDGRSAKDPKVIQKTFDTLDRQTQQLVKLNEDLLLLERSKTSHKNARKHNLSNLLLDVVDSEYAQASQNKVTIKTKVEPHVTGFITDKDWICIAQNLLDNAVKYSNPSGKVLVSLKHDKQGVIFTVQDQGIGIPVKEVTQIGQRFYRATNVGRVPGTGLGLAIVSQIVSSYNGVISFKSNPKKGTLVTIHLPINKN